MPSFTDGECIMISGMRANEWKGCVAADRNGWLCIKIKVDGKWRYRSTRLKDSPENRGKADASSARCGRGCTPRLQ